MAIENCFKNFIQTKLYVWGAERTKSVFNNKNDQSLYILLYIQIAISDVCNTFHIYIYLFIQL